MRFYVISLLAVALLFAPISARRMRRQAEAETTTESGSETSTDLNNSGAEASGEESGIETSGAETSGAEGSGLESSGSETSTDLNNSGTEASGEESGVETSGAEGSGLESSGNEASGEVNNGTTSAGTEDETSGELSGEEPTEGPIPVLTLTTLQASALDIQTQADAIALQTQAINDQINTLTQDVQKLEDATKQLNSQVSNAIIQAGSTPTTSTNQTTPTGDNSTCSLDMACFAEADCNGGTCVGAFVGTCNCNACFQFKACTDDSQCGGFKTACNNFTRTCDCFQAYTNNGLSFFDAQISMCNTQNCTTDNNTDACFGLPCNAGRCVC